MPVLFDENASLLRLGVGNGVIADIQPFDLGGAGVITNEQPFTIEAPFAGAQNYQVFSIGSFFGTTNSQPFDLGEVVSVTNIQPFDMIALIPNPSMGTSQPTPPLTFSTTLSAPAAVGDTSITVVSTTGIRVGSMITITRADGTKEYRIVTSIT